MPAKPNAALTWVGPHGTFLDKHQFSSTAPLAKPPRVHPIKFTTAPRRGRPTNPPRVPCTGSRGEDAESLGRKRKARITSSTSRPRGYPRGGWSHPGDDETPFTHPHEALSPHLRLRAASSSSVAASPNRDFAPRLRTASPSPSPASVCHDFAHFQSSSRVFEVRIDQRGRAASSISNCELRLRAASRAARSRSAGEPRVVPARSSSVL